MKHAAVAILGILFLLAGACGSEHESRSAEVARVVNCQALEPRAASTLRLTTAETQVLRTACQRIPELRQGEITIKVLDSAGKPVTDTAVRVSQTRHDFLFGGQPNEIVRGVLSADERPRFEQLFLALFNHVWLGGGFQWASYEPVRGGARPESAESYLRWAQQSRLSVRAGDLVYQLFFPAWFKELADPAERLRLGLEHIRAVTTRFRGRVPIWEVANETEFRPAITDRSERFTFNIPIEAKYRRIADYLDPAFREARRSDPEAALVLNEARLIGGLALGRFEVLLKELKRRGTPFDVVGIQTHMKADGRVSLDVVQVNLGRLSQYGRLHLTEVSVPWRPWLPGEQIFQGVPWSGWSEETQAAYTVALYTVFFGHPSVDAITYWATAERTSDPTVLGTALLSESLVPRPAYNALRRLLTETWWTQFDAKTDENGTLRMRAFYGEYELLVSPPRGTPQRLAFRLRPGARELTLALQPKP